MGEGHLSEVEIEDKVLVDVETSTGFNDGPGLDSLQLVD